MTVEEMINFELNKCVTHIQGDLEFKIINGIYKVSQKNELLFNEEEIKKMLLMFKPMQEELRVYKKALDLLSIQYSYCFHRGKDCPFDDEAWRNIPWCDDIRHDLECSRECIARFYLQKAREENDQ